MYQDVYGDLLGHLIVCLTFTLTHGYTKKISTMVEKDNIHP